MNDVEERLQDAGARWRAEQTTPVVDLSSATRTPSRSRRIVLTAAAVVIAAGLLVALVGRDTGSGRHPQVTVTPTTIGGGVGVIDLNSAIVQPNVLAVDGNRLWVSGTASAGVSKPAQLQEIDATTGQLIGAVTLPDDGPYGVSVGDGALWVNAQQKEDWTELLKIDVASLKIVARIRNVVSGQSAVTADAVWALDGAGALKRIEPATGRVVATIQVAADGIYAPLAVAAGPGGVWVGNTYRGNVQRIDPTTNTAGPTVHLAANLDKMVVVGQSLWVETSFGNQLIEVVGTKPVRTIDLGEGTVDLVSDGGALWLGTDSAHLVRVDVSSGAISRVALPPGTIAPVPAADPATGSVWVASREPSPRLIRVARPTH